MGLLYFGYASGVFCDGCCPEFYKLGYSKTDAVRIKRMKKNCERNKHTKSVLVLRYKHFSIAFNSNGTLKIKIADLKGKLIWESN
jgi:hypothetical protein